MISVIHVLSDINIGGAGKSELNLFRHMDRARINISCIIPKDSLLKPELTACGVRIIEVEGIGGKSFDIKNITVFIGIFRKEKPDIVHTHAGLSARIAAKCLGIKTIYTRHWADISKVNIIKKLLNNQLCDIAIGVSKSACDAIIHTGVSPNKVRVVFNGIEPFRIFSDEERTRARRGLGFDESHIVIGTVARLEEEKGHIYLLQAAVELLKSHPELRFVFAGEGSLKTELTKQAKLLGISDKVIIPGFIKDVEGLLNCLDIYVLPSRTEAFGLSIVEAMSVKCPCIATECGGIIEVLDKDTTGLLVPVKDSAALTKAIIRMIEDKQLAIDLSENAYKIMNEKFTSRTMSKRMEEIYMQLNTKSKKEAEHLVI